MTTTTTTSKKIRDVMSEHPVTLEHDASAADAARTMRDRDVGNVLVLRDGSIVGIVTDRDLVVRCLADGTAASDTTLETLCTREPVTLSPDDEVRKAIDLMKDRAIRRIPVVENDRPVGILSIGDLAIEVDRDSALGRISEASPNN